MRRSAPLLLLVGLLFAVVLWWLLAGRPASEPGATALEHDEEPVPPAVLQGVDSPARPDGPEARKGAPLSESTPRRVGTDPARTRRVRGVVFDDRGVPVADARLFSGISGWIRSDENGRFELVVADGPDVVNCQGAPGHRGRTWRTRIAPDQDYVELVLEPGPSLVLRVLDADGLPVSGAWIHTTDGDMVEGRTDLDGRAVLDVDAPDLDHEVWISPRELDPPHPDVVVGPFRAGAHVHVVRLPEAHWIEGRVCWPDGQPAVLGDGGARVEVAHPFAPLRVVTDVLTGRFRIGPVAPGEHGIRAWWGSEDYAPARFEDVSVPSEPVRLVIPNVGTLECTVALAEGAKIVQATWVAQGTACEIGLSSRTPARLRAYLPDVEGTFYVQDSGGRYAYFPDVRLSDVPGTILLSEGGEISGVLIYDDLAHVVLETKDVPIRGHVDLVADIDEPPFRILGLPPSTEGTLRVLLGKHEPRVIHERHVQSGIRDLRIELPLEPMARD